MFFLSSKVVNVLFKNNSPGKYNIPFFLQITPTLSIFPAKTEIVNPYSSNGVGERVRAIFKTQLNMFDGNF